MILSLLTRLLFACLAGLAVLLLSWGGARLAFGDGPQQQTDIADHMLSGECISEDSQTVDIYTPLIHRYILDSAVFAITAGTVLAVLWTLPAVWLRRREHSVELRAGYRHAWIGALVVTALVVFVTSRYASDLENIERCIQTNSKYLLLCIFVSLALIAYWIATAVSADRSVRHAVPLAHHLP